MGRGSIFWLPETIVFYMAKSYNSIKLNFQLRSFCLCIACHKLDICKRQCRNGGKNAEKMCRGQ